MRPTAPQLLAPKFFFKWKQRHQVRYGFGGGGRLQAQYPPPYSTAAQVGALCSFLFRTYFILFASWTSAGIVCRILIYANSLLQDLPVCNPTHQDCGAELQLSPSRRRTWTVAPGCFLLPPAAGWLRALRPER